jgi:hypothetical protein
MNTLLNRTVNSFFPNKASCAFVGEPWFFCNYQVQLDVLRLCVAGYAHYIKTCSDEATFTDHVFGLLVLFQPQNFLEELVKGIEHGKYLLTCGWFRRSLRHHVSLFLIKIHGYFHWIDPLAGDFDDHIYSIIRQIQTNELMEREAGVFVEEPSSSQRDANEKSIHRILTEPLIEQMDQNDEDDDDDVDEDEPPRHMRRMKSDDEYDSNAEVDDADAHYGYVC